MERAAHDRALRELERANRPPATTKQCNGCLQELPFSYFSRKNDKNRPNSLYQPLCKYCIRSKRGAQKRPETIEEAFWRYAGTPGNSNECWVWQGYRDDSQEPEKGYGIFAFARKIYRAHCFSFELHKGPIPFGLIVCHTCDNPPCWNPEHLFLGTNATNAIDSMLKGRKKKTGKIRRGSKLTIPDVRCIKSLRGTATAESVAADFNISLVYVYEIWRGVAWPDIV